MKERLARHRIVAPFDGVIARRNVDPGDWLDPGGAALTLVTDDRVEVFVRVPPGFLDRVGKVEVVNARVDKNGKSVPAKVVGQVRALDPTTRTALIRLRPTEDATWLRAGDTANVSFSVPRSGGVVLPRDALVYGVAEVRVVKIVDGKAKPVVVEVLATNGQQVLVKSDALVPSDAVVIRGNERLRPGQPLSVTSGAPPAASAGAPTP